MAMNPWTFTLHGKPFFPLGGQSNNSSAYTIDDLQRALTAVAVMGANTLEVPVYWEQFESERGLFDHTMVDMLIAAAREKKIKLILLWFATWKNGTMKYAPAWVKADPAMYRRIYGPDGGMLAGLDPTCPANLEADKRAFVALINRIKEIDSEQRTVLAIQIENESGIMGSDRDYSEAGEKQFRAPLPAAVLTALRTSPPFPGRPAPEQPLTERSTWTDAFPLYPGEAFTAWHIARFINVLAGEAKRLFPELALYTNAWVQEHGFRVPGLNYPAGGPTRNLLDLWKLATPNLDLLAPDIYIREDEGFHAAASAYAREDNPLFIPESGGLEATSLHLLHAIANLGAIGYAMFGIEGLIDAEGKVRPHTQAAVDSFRFVRAALPLILKYRGTGRMHALLGRPQRYDQLLPLSGPWMAMARFEGGDTDYHHRGETFAGPGRGLLFQVSDHELFLVGANLRLLFKKRGTMASLFHSNSAQEVFGQRTINFVLIEEGTFDEDEKWVVQRRRNGDESDSGVWVQPDVGVVRVVLGD